MRAVPDRSWTPDNRARRISRRPLSPASAAARIFYGGEDRDLAAPSRAFPDSWPAPTALARSPSRATTATPMQNAAVTAPLPRDPPCSTPVRPGAPLLLRRVKTPQPLGRRRRREATAIDIVLRHPEYQALLASGDEAVLSRLDAGRRRMNPFLHLSLHPAVAEQTLSTSRRRGARRLAEAGGPPLRPAWPNMSSFECPRNHLRAVSRRRHGCRGLRGKQRSSARRLTRRTTGNRFIMNPSPPVCLSACALETGIHDRRTRKDTDALRKAQTPMSQPAICR